MTGEAVTEPMTELRFWMQVMVDSERTVLCPPEYESRIKSWVEAQGVAGIIHVMASPICPEHSIIVMDHNALEATMRKSLTMDAARWRI